MKGYYDCGYDKLMQGVDPTDNDPDAWITDEGECSECGYKFGPGELDLPTPIFAVEESGVTPDTPDGPGEHWAVGYIDCPNCHAHLPYEAA